MAVKIKDNTDTVKFVVENGIGLSIRLMLEDIYTGSTEGTPRKSGDLRNRVLRKMESNSKGTITWETSYAEVQEKGYRDSKHGRVYFRKYTTPGTGPHYAENAVEKVVNNITDYIDKVGIA